MFSFWFSKFQYFFNATKSQTFKLLFVIFPFICNFPRILFKKRNIWIVGVTTILLPCLINVSLLSGGQTGLENNKGFQMPVNVGKMQEFTKIVATSKVPEVSIMSQEGDFRQKSVSKDGSGFVELLSLISTYAKAMTYQKAEQECYEREKRTGQDLNCERFHYIDIMLCFILGCLSARVIPIVWKYLFYT